MITFQARQKSKGHVGVTVHRNAQVCILPRIGKEAGKYSEEKRVDVSKYAGLTGRRYLLHTGAGGKGDHDLLT